MVLVELPATIGLVMMAEPMLSILLQYNEFGVSDVHYAGLSPKAYSLGLLGFILIKCWCRALPRVDMKTSVQYGAYAMLYGLSLNMVLVFPLTQC